MQIRSYMQISRHQLRIPNKVSTLEFYGQRLQLNIVYEEKEETSAWNMRINKGNTACSNISQRPRSLY